MFKRTNIWFHHITINLLTLFLSFRINKLHLWSSLDFCLRWRNHQIINEVVNRNIQKNMFENRKCKVYRGFDPILLSQDRIISIQLTFRSITFIEPKSIINLSCRINIRSDFICTTLYMILYFYILPLCFYREKKVTSTKATDKYNEKKNWFMYASFQKKLLFLNR